jgi:hypothetical protein
MQSARVVELEQGGALGAPRAHGFRSALASDGGAGGRGASQAAKVKARNATNVRAAVTASALEKTFRAARFF